MPTPEELARQNIDKLLTQCGRQVQKRSEINLSAGRGIAITEGLLKGGDNVLFEGGAGETVRRELLKQADVHTLLRLPTGIFYAQGVKANVLFFDRKPAAEKPWTEKLWIYDLRTNKHFTLKENPMMRSDLDDFVNCYLGGKNGDTTPLLQRNRHERKESERFKGYTYEELSTRDKLNLDIFWLKDESLEDSANLPPPDVIAAEIVEDLQAALTQFAEIANDLKK
jgi:type I restriction enzyme M protein